MMALKPFKLESTVATLVFMDGINLTNNLCLNGGQIILSGANTTTTGITFTATTTLTQNAKWIAIGSCPGQYGIGGSRGIVFDDLLICW